MAKETPHPQAQPAPEKTPAPVSTSSFPIKKMLIIGVPLLLVQLGVIYFLVWKLMTPAAATETKAEQTVPEHAEEKTSSAVFLVKDLLVNPAGTNGTRFLLTTIGFEVPSDEAKKMLESKEVQIRDLLISVLASKGLEELTNLQQREMIRKEIAVKTKDIIKGDNLKNIYFSKFIIQ